MFCVFVEGNFEKVRDRIRSYGNAIHDNPPNPRELLSSNGALAVETVGLLATVAYGAALTATELMPLNGTFFNPTNFGLYTWQTYCMEGAAVLCALSIVTNLGIRCVDRCSEGSGEEEKLICDRVQDTPYKEDVEILYDDNDSCPNFEIKMKNREEPKEGRFLPRAKPPEYRLASRPGDCGTPYKPPTRGARSYSG